MGVAGFEGDFFVRLYRLDDAVSHVLFRVGWLGERWTWLN
jgi:hypothetical protein